jgi:hypothetical protein
MSECSIRGKSLSATHKRHATAPQDEGPLPSPSPSPSPSSNPKIPADLIAGLILPFVADQITWNDVHCASKELCLAGKNMTPPWPNKAFNDLGHEVREVAFSPSGSQLALGVNTVRHNGACQTAVRIWDRWGKETLLVAHTGHTG